MPDDPTLPQDPFYGNRMSGLLGCALGSQPPEVEPTIPEHWEPPTPAHIAELLPQYQIEHLIGRGGMGAVYKGRQITLNRPVAIKVLPAELARSADFVARFHREAQLLASLSHQSIVTIFDFGQTAEGHLYFVMEYVNGTDLHRLIHRSPVKLEPEHALHLIMQICEAMQYAHDMGVVHRDIKPANVLVTRDGRAKLADFGLAMKPSEAAELSPSVPVPQGFELGSPSTADLAALRFTKTGNIMGTPPYAAPEVYQGQADERSDIFALGIMFYEMLTGNVPEPRYQLPSEKAGVDARLDEVVVKALEASPEERFQKASEMKAAVERATRPLAKAPPIPPRQVQPQPAVVAVARSSGPLAATPSMIRRPGGPMQAARYAPSAPQRQPRRVLRLTGLVLAGALVAGASYDAGRDWEWVGKLISQFMRAATGMSSTQRNEIQQCLLRGREWVSQVTEPAPKGQLLANLAGVQARIGGVEEAILAAQAIETPEERLTGLVKVMRALCHEGDYPGAIRCAKLITDTDPRELALLEIVQSQIYSGSTRQLAEAADMITTPGGKAALDAISALAILMAGDKTSAMSLLTRARGLVDKATEGSGKFGAQRRIVAALVHAGEVEQANAIALAINGDPKGDQRGHIAIIQAEMGNDKEAIQTCNNLPSAWARGWTFEGIARVQLARGLAADARQTAQRIPYMNQRVRGLMRLCIQEGDVAGAKNMLAEIAKDTRNLVEAGQMYRDAISEVAELIVRVQGLDAAVKWLETMPDGLPRARAWVAMAEAHFPGRSPLTPVPKIGLKLLKDFAGVASVDGKDSDSKPATVIYGETTDNEGYVALFDADHRGGWRQTQEGGFTESEGVYKSWAPRPDTWGLLWYSEKAYSDFVLRFDFMVDTNEVNSGVYLRLPLLGQERPPMYFSEAYEMEIRGEDTGIIPHVKPQQDYPPPIRIGTWNQCEIVVQGQLYVFKINGQLVTRFLGDRDLKGYIGFQNKTSRGAAHFRNVRIKDLSKSKAP